MSKPGSSAAEGRAIAARPSLRLAIMLGLAFFALAATAKAAPPTPILTGTNPSSPGTSLTPVVHGNSSGVIISSLGGPRPRAIRSGSEAEGRTIAVYLNKTCEGEPAASGTAEALDTTGIQVTVPAETKTYIAVTQTDSTGTSSCSKAIEYEQVKELPPPPSEPPPSEPPPTPPSSGSGSGSSGNGGTTAAPEPPHLRTVPGGYGNDSTPLVTGSAPGASSVKVFAGSGCQGTPVAKVTAAQLDAGVPVPVPSNAVVALYGVSIGPDGAQSNCSPPVYYLEDSLAPHVRITMGPAAKTRKRKAVFRFTDTTGDAPGTAFYCQVDGKKWKPCSSPLRLKHLKRRRYTLKVRATDPAGNAELKPAKRSFKVI
jgi:hypothetical protein